MATGDTVDAVSPALRAMRALVWCSLLILAIAPSIFIATTYLENFSSPGSTIRPFTDANTYLAAGERLNAGHDLYRLSPGDRTVDVVEGRFTVPLVGPPFMAVVWRPIAAFDLGMYAWVALCWAALLGAMTYLVWKIGVIAVIACLLLCIPVGEQLAVANVSSLFPAMLIVVWIARDSTRTPGVLIALMASAKLAPIALVAWLVGRRDRSGLVTTAITFIALGVLTLVGAGLANVLAFRVVFSDVQPSTFSIASITGQPYATYFVLIVGSTLAALAGRWPGFSFGVAIVTATIGTPALYAAALVPLLALISPLTEKPAQSWTRYLAWNDGR